MTSTPPNDSVGYILERLAPSKAPVFRPVYGESDIDLAVRAQDGQYVELICLTGQSDAPRGFEAPRFRRRPSLIMACIVSEPGGPVTAWLIPSGVFERYATPLPGCRSKLDLDSDDLGPLHERLAVYRERWALITTFTKFRSTLEDPLALRVRLAMG